MYKLRLNREKINYYYTYTKFNEPVVVKSLTKNRASIN